VEKRGGNHQRPGKIGNKKGHPVNANQAHRVWPRTAGKWAGLWGRGDSHWAGEPGNSKAHNQRTRDGPRQKVKGTGLDKQDCKIRTEPNNTNEEKKKKKSARTRITPATSPQVEKTVRTERTRGAVEVKRRPGRHPQHALHKKKAQSPPTVTRNRLGA